MSEWTIRPKKTSDSLIFGEQPEWFAHITLFWWATWAIRSRRSLIKVGMNEWLIFLYKKTYIKRTEKYNLSQIVLSKLLIRSIIMINLRESLTVAHLSRAIRAQLFIWFVRSERMSKWANEQMSEFPALQCSRDFKKYFNPSQTLFWKEEKTAFHQTSLQKVIN